jgi:hypothetical protein
MRLRVRYTGADVIIQGLVTPPFGPGFAPAVLADADALEVWTSTWADAADAVVWRLSRHGTVLAATLIDGW